MATGLEKASFHSSVKECLNCCTVVLISHASKAVLKILQARLQHLCEPTTSKLGLEESEEPEIKLPTFVGSWKKQGNSRKTSNSALLTMLKPLTLWITTNWKILQEMGVPDHLTSFPRKLYAGQEATVRTRHGARDWFKIGEGVWKSCILSFCLFNF